MFKGQTIDVDMTTYPLPTSWTELPQDCPCSMLFDEIPQSKDCHGPNEWLVWITPEDLTIPCRASYTCNKHIGFYNDGVCIPLARLGL